MTTRSLRLLHLLPTEHDAFAKAHKDAPLKRQVYLLGTCPALIYLLEMSSLAFRVDVLSVAHH